MLKRTKAISFVIYFKFHFTIPFAFCVHFNEYEPLNVFSYDKTEMNSTQGDKAALMDNPTN